MAKQGTVVKNLLVKAGINPTAVTQSRLTKHYRVEFSSMTSTDPAEVWVERLRAAFTGVNVVSARNWVADWRDTNDVINAVVVIDGIPTLKPQPEPTPEIDSLTNFIEVRDECYLLIYMDEKVVYRLYKKDDPRLFWKLYRNAFKDTDNLYSRDTVTEAWTGYRGERVVEIFDYSDPDASDDPDYRLQFIQGDEDDVIPDDDPFFRVDWFGDGKGGE